MGFVKDCMVFFKKVEEDEKKVKEKQFMQKKLLILIFVNRFSVLLLISLVGLMSLVIMIEKVLFKKVLDFNKM